MSNTNTHAGHEGRIFSRLQITDLDALPEEDSQIFDPGILVKGCSHQIVAPYQSGKTFLSWLCAKEFLQNGLIVAYLDYENRGSSIKKRLDTIGVDTRDRKKNLLYLNNPNLDLSPESKAQWEAFLAHHRPDLIIFDSLNGFLSNAGKEENSATGLSMSRMLWVWFSYCFEGIHREVALQRPLLAAPQSYLRR